MGTTYAEMRGAALRAEQSGFDGIWTWDHLRSTGGEGATPEAWTVLSGLAEAVPRIAIGPLVLNVINRRPAVLANMAATLQDLSGGRLILGIGAGGGRSTPYAREQEAIGQPIGSDKARAARVIETLEVIQRLWAGSDVSFDGRYYQLQRPQGYLRPVVRPPVIVGAFGARMARIAGSHADGLNTQASHPRLEAMIDVARRAHLEAGRSNEGFLVTVFAGLPERWLRRDSPDRARLATLGVDRLILLIEPPYPLDAIAEAGTLLTR